MKTRRNQEKIHSIRTKKAVSEKYKWQGETKTPTSSTQNEQTLINNKIRRRRGVISTSTNCSSRIRFKLQSVTEAAELPRKGAAMKIK